MKTDNHDAIKDLQKEVLEAITRDDCAAIRKIFKDRHKLVNTPLKTGGDKAAYFINLRDEFGLTFLHEAAVTGKANAVDALLTQSHIDVLALTPKHFSSKGQRTASQLARDSNFNGLAAFVGAVENKAASKSVHMSAKNITADGIEGNWSDDHEPASNTPPEDGWKSGITTSRGKRHRGGV